MGYSANGNGSATLKKGTDTGLLLKLLDSSDLSSDVEFDITKKVGGSDDTSITFWESDSHWHEENTFEFLNLLIPYISEGKAYYDGNDDCHWCYVFVPEEEEWVTENGRVYYDVEQKFNALLKKYEAKRDSDDAGRKYWQTKIDALLELKEVLNA